MDDEKGQNYGWLFIVLLLFFGIFSGRAGGLLGGGNANAGTSSITDLVALQSLQNNKGGCCNSERDILDLKCTMTSQNAVLNEGLNTAFRTILTNQDAGFAGLRTSMLEDAIRARDMTMMAQNTEIQGLKSQIYNDGRFNSIERAIEAGFCQTVKKPPFFPRGCSPCTDGIHPAMS